MFHPQKDVYADFCTFSFHHFHASTNQDAMFEQEKKKKKMKEEEEEEEDRKTNAHLSNIFKQTFYLLLVAMLIVIIIIIYIISNIFTSTYLFSMQITYECIYKVNLKRMKKKMMRKDDRSRYDFNSSSSHYLLTRCCMRLYHVKYSFM